MNQGRLNLLLDSLLFSINQWKGKKNHYVFIIQNRFLNRSVKFSIIKMSKEAVNHMQLMSRCCDSTIKYCDSRK